MFASAQQSSGKELGLNHRSTERRVKTGICSRFACASCFLRSEQTYMFSIQDTPSGAMFVIKVHPPGRKNAITGEIGGTPETVFDRSSSGWTSQGGLHRVLR